MAKAGDAGEEKRSLVVAALIFETAVDEEAEDVGEGHVVPLDRVFAEPVG